MPIETKALEAMRQTLGSETADLVEAKKLVELFIYVFEHHRPAGIFSAKDINDWLTKYKALEEEVVIPRQLKSPVSTGRFLRDNQEMLKITEQGTYGNKIMYVKKGNDDE